VQITEEITDGTVSNNITTEPEAAVEPYGVVHWRALGTYVQLVIEGGHRLADGQAIATRLLAEVDRTCSRFREDSDLIRANRNAGTWTPVDPLLVAATAAALEAAAQTGGLVDPTLGRSMVAAGYDRTIDEVRGSDGPAAIPIPAVPNAWRQVELDPDGAIRVPTGVALDLGATGKAFASDLIADAILRNLGAGCVFSLGGDVAIRQSFDQPTDRPVDRLADRLVEELADSLTSRNAEGRGVDGMDDGSPVPWQVTVSETVDEEPAAVVTVTSGGIATSTVMARRWQRGGTLLHHVLDPATGRPVDPIWRTATVAAPTCFAANTASTATLVLGDAAEEWLAGRPVTARLVSRDGEVRYVGEWSEAAL
jgi:thiamine biosynthesis lipoprotein